MKLIRSGREYRELEQKFEVLKVEHKKIQESFSILTVKAEEAATYTGNPYKTYNGQVTAISDKYNSTADWGNQIVNNIIEVRSAFTIGPGVEAMLLKEGKTEELNFIEDFMRRNDLFFRSPLAWAKEAEIEGKCLVRLDVKGNPKWIHIRFVPWSLVSYTVNPKKGDYSTIENITYENETGKTGTVTLKPENMAYIKFGGRAFEANKTSPKLAGVLRQVEDLDKALWDWRKLNHLFASPTPVFECEDKEEAQDIRAWMSNANWKIGKLLITTAKFRLEGADAAGAEMLMREIESHAKVISGAVGVPVHFLGFVDLMSNRATAKSLLELVMASTTVARTLWKDFYTEVFRKVLTLANEEMEKSFDPDSIGADIPQISAAKIQELGETWLPMYIDGAISLETFLSKVPEVDVRKEMKRIEKQEKSPPRRRDVPVPERVEEENERE